LSETYRLERRDSTKLQLAETAVSIWTKRL
jgi:hypothetical protein